MTIAERIKELINKLSMPQNKFAQMLNISAPRLNNYLSGNREFPKDILVNIAKITNCELTWLITGTGPMYNERARVKDESQTVALPVVADIAAGIGIEAEGIEPTEFITLDRSLLPVPGRFTAFRVCGSSMEPEIHPGDYAIIQAWEFDQDYDGTICAFRSIDGLLIKRLVYNHGKRRALLVPLNSSQPIIQYDATSPDLIMIGPVVAIIRRFLL